MFAMPPKWFQMAAYLPVN